MSESNHVLVMLMIEFFDHERRAGNEEHKKEEAVWHQAMGDCDCNCWLEHGHQMDDEEDRLRQSWKRIEEAIYTLIALRAILKS